MTTSRMLKIHFLFSKHFGDDIYLTRALKHEKLEIDSTEVGRYV